MRKDMSKVVTERPRYGHSMRSKKTALRVSRWNRDRFYDGKDGLDGPSRLSSSRFRQFGWDGKEFSDRLGPLKKFLRRQVGRHWDSVYSDLSRTLDKRSLTGRHIWTHIWQFVKKDCVIGPDRNIYEHNPRAYNERWRVHGLYIHPKTGILSWAGE